MTGDPNPKPNPPSMAILSPRSLTLTLTLILALFPFLSAAPLPHPSPSPARPSPLRQHPPPSLNSHSSLPHHPSPTPSLKSHPSPPHHPHPSPPSLPLSKSPGNLMAKPNTVHVGPPSNQQRPPCSTSGQNCHNESRLPRRNAPPPPLRKGRRLNFGKKLGLLFAGIGILLQIGLGGFLGFKRWQLKMLEDGPQENRSGRRRLRVPSSASSSS